MQNSDLILGVLYGESEIAESVTLNGETVFENKELTAVTEYMDALKSNGWELVKVLRVPSGKIYQFLSVVK